MAIVTNRGFGRISKMKYQPSQKYAPGDNVWFPWKDEKKFGTVSKVYIDDGQVYLDILIPGEHCHGVPEVNCWQSSPDCKEHGKMLYHDGKGDFFCPWCEQ